MKVEKHLKLVRLAACFLTDASLTNTTAQTGVTSLQPLSTPGDRTPILQGFSHCGFLFILMFSALHKAGHTSVPQTSENKHRPPVLLHCL